jgi:hypothetical protein
MSTNAVAQHRTTRPALLSALFLAGIAWLSAAPSHASVTGAWSDNVSQDQSFSRVLVVGISPNRNQRCAFERAMAAKIESATTAAIISCDAMGVEDPLTRESIEAVVASKNADAVLATSLISKTWDVQDGGTSDTRGGAYYKASDAYYGAYGTVVATDFQTSESITTIKGEVHVTSKLYETRGATVVYTVDTKVRNIESRSEGLAAITGPIGKKLRKDKVIR